MLPPGEQSSIAFKTHMGRGMEGPHVFEIVVQTNDGTEPVSILTVTADFRNASASHGQP
jgi:hypothetical protein